MYGLVGLVELALYVPGPLICAVIIGYQRRGLVVAVQLTDKVLQ